MADSAALSSVAVGPAWAIGAACAGTGSARRHCKKDIIVIVIVIVVSVTATATVAVAW